MRDDVYFFIILIIIYAGECFYIITRGTVVLYSPFLLKWKYYFFDVLPHFAGRMLFLCNPLPPFGTGFACSPLPMALSPYGLCGIDANTTKQCQAGIFIFEDIRSISHSESKLLINGSVVAFLNSAEMAGWLADSLKKIASAYGSSRELLIEDFLNAAFETDAARASYQVFKKITFFLRILSTALFFHLFFVLPVSVYGGFFGKIWLQLLVIFLVLMLSIALNYYRAHVVLFGASRAGLLSNLIMMLFSPPLAIRSVDFLSKNLLYRYHPLAVASVLLDGDDFRSLSHRFIRELRFPKFQVREAEADRIIAWYNDKVFQVISKRFSDLKTEDAYKPPVRENDSIVAYCPRCHCQYTRNGTCSDCGIGLAEYDV